MTAASVFMGGDASYLISDAGSFLEDGTLVAIGSKVLACDRLRVALVMSGCECIQVNDSGCYSPANDVQLLLDQCRSQAEFLAKLPLLIRTLHTVTLKVGWGFYQFTIALWNVAGATSRRVCDRLAWAHL